MNQRERSAGQKKKQLESSLTSSSQVTTTTHRIAAIKKIPINISKQIFKLLFICLAHTLVQCSLRNLVCTLELLVCILALESVHTTLRVRLTLPPY